MSRLTKYISSTLSLRLSLMVISALATLLIGALFIMLYFSRKALKEEAINDAAQTLEATVNRIDNVLLDVEQATGNVYWRMRGYIHQPEKMEGYAQRLVEESPYIIDYHFLWNTDTSSVDTEVMGWIEPRHRHQVGDEALMTFRLPLYEGRKVVGVFDVDVSLTQLSKIMLESKPSPNSYSVLLGKDGKVIVFPDSSFLNKNAFELSRKYDNNAEAEAIQAMMSGGSDYRYVKMEGQDCYVFYKPFVRADIPGRARIDLGWSAGIIYPEDDIFGDYNRLLYIVLIIAAVGLLLLFIHCRVFIHRQFVPLRQLEKSAQAIANGFYDEPIPDSRRQDEIGGLQKHFQKMQQSLATHVGEMQRASALLQERGEVLQTAYEQAQAGDRMKTNFLYNMSDQMKSPIDEICDRVMTISEHVHELSEEDTNRLVDEIQQRGGKVTALLNQLIADSENIMS